MRVVSLKINSNVYLLKNTNSLYLLFNTTIIPLHNSKISLIFFWGSCHFLSNKSVFLQILYPSSVSWKITPLYFFSSSNIYFAQKEHIKMKILETYESSAQNLSNFLCQFWNDKSIPLQILYLSSVSWKIIPLYFFSSNNIYFAQKEHIKMKIFETFKCSGQNSSNSSCQFWNDKSIPLQIFHHSLLSWHITPLWILSLYFFYLGLKDLIKIPIWRLSGVLVEIYRIVHVIFQTTSQFFFLSSLFNVMEGNSSVLF